jgi:hypothetical protein
MPRKVASRAVAVVTALVVAVAAPVVIAATPAKRPPSGAKYTGVTNQGKKIQIWISGTSLQLFGFEIRCAGVGARSSLQDVAITRTKRVYGFDIRAHGSFTYLDNRPDQNGSIAIKGTFSATAKSARGELRTSTPRCGSSGRVTWHATRR